MKWIETRISFKADHPAFAADLISYLFSKLGISGVVFEEPHADSCLDWGADAVQRHAQHAVVAYLPQDRQFQAKLKLMEKWLARLAISHDILSQTTCQEVAEEDWAESWKKYFQHQKIGQKIAVKPSWQAYQPEPGEIVLELDPGMAFGTGTHPSTALCIQMLEKYIQKGARVLDVGTGSGILLLTALKLGAEFGLGVDKDENAVSIARQNLSANRIERRRFQIQRANLLSGVDGRFDLVVANILSKVILQLLDDLKRVLNPQALFICSGILEEDAPVLTEKMHTLGFGVKEMRTHQEWVVMVTQKENLCDQ